MLETLDSVDFSKVQHAYGPATDLPQHLRALASEDARQRRAALEWFSMSVNHQGAITPAALPAAPFLVELASEPKSKERPWLLSFLAELAVGGNHVRYLAHGFDVNDEAFQKTPDDHPRKAIYLHVARGIDAYLSMLGDKDAKVRTAAAFLSAFLSSEASKSIATVRKQLGVEKSEQPRASQLLALGLLGGYLKTKEDVALFRAHEASDVLLVRVAARIGLHYAAESELSQEVLEQLVLAIPELAQPIPDFPWAEGQLSNYVALVVSGLAARRRQTELLGRLLAVTAKTPTQPRVASAMLASVFSGEHAAHQLRLPSELDDIQRHVLTQLVELELVPRVRGALAYHGLFAAPADLKRFLGLTEQGPVDRAVSGEPLWRAIAGVLAGTLNMETWLERVRTLSASEILSLAADAAEPPYALNVAGQRASGDDSRSATLARAAGLQQVLSRTLSESVPTEAIAASADALLASESRSGSWAAVLVVALSDALDRAGQTLPPRFDALIAELSNAEEAYATDLRRVLGRLPLERREALIMPLPLEGYARTEGGKRVLYVRRGWLYIDLCPTQAAVEKTIATILRWPKPMPLPEPKAIEVLTSMAEFSRPQLAKLLANADVPQRALFERVLAQLPQRSARPV
jgi:hypothetical protein